MDELQGNRRCQHVTTVAANVFLNCCITTGEVSAATANPAEVLWKKETGDVIYLLKKSVYSVL